MKRYSLNENWTVSLLDGSEKKTIRLPHDAMLSEKQVPTSKGGINIGWYEGLDYRYEKELEIPADQVSKHLTLEFEGVYHNAEVYLNGQKLAFHPYGYTGFYVTLDGLVHSGANHLEVVAHNSDQPNSRWYSGTGIYRPVWLWVGEKEQYLPVNPMRIKTVSINPAAVEVSVKQVGEGTPKIEILDGETVIASAEGAVNTISIPNAELWCPENPKLYTCRVSLGTDVVEEHFGVRTIAWDTENGLSLNGKHIILRGACIHHDNGLLGACTYPEAEERRVRILQENGYNAIRSAHNPCSKDLLDACDKLGMLMMDEYVDCWYIHKNQHDYVNYFMDWWQQDLADMVEKDYNHPCVVMYSTGNEVAETGQKKGIEITRLMTEHLHSMDDTRPVTCGINIFFNFLYAMGFGVYSDDKAKKAADAKPGKKKKKASVGSQFFNDLAGILGGDTMKLGATFYGCDVKTRGAFANMDIAGYNYGIWRYGHDLRKYPNRLILGSETFCSDAALFWRQAKKNNRILGDFVWAGMDYLGEVGIGTQEYADYAPDFGHQTGWVSAGSGRIDLIGTPIGEALYTRVVFEQEHRPMIAVRPVNHTHDRHSPSSWKMTNAIPSWNWPGYDGSDAVVEVYTYAPKVELVLNGKSLGIKKGNKNARVIFKTNYQSGELTAIARDAQGNELSRYSITSGTEVKLSAKPETDAAQKGSLVYIPLEYVDEHGDVQPLERHRIAVKVTGGELVGLGHACPYNPDGFLKSETDTYYGRALAIVRVLGDVTLTATDGERTAVAKIAEK